MEQCKKTGEVLRQIRKNKSATISEFYGTIISRQYAYRIEKNLQHIGQQKLQQILAQNDILLDEFLFIQYDFTQSDLEDIIQQFSDIKSNLEICQIQQLLKRIQKYPIRKHSFFDNLQHILQAYQAFHHHQDSLLLQQSIYKVWQVLAKKEEWTYCDLTLVSTMVFVFDIHDLDTMMRRLLKELNRYTTYRNITKLQLVVTFNYCTVLRLNQKYQKTKPILHTILEKANRLHDGLLICECEFRLAEIAWLEKEKDTSILNQRVSQVLQTLVFLNYSSIAQDLRKDWYKRTGMKLEIPEINKNSSVSST